MKINDLGLPEIPLGGGAGDALTGHTRGEIAGTEIGGKSPTLHPVMFGEELQDVDAFFRFDQLDDSSFNKLFPYSFVVWDTKENKILASCYFPLPPQSITVSANTASTITATMRGMVEDNNGAPFRDISIQGTTSVGWMPGLSAIKEPAGAAADLLAENLAFAFSNTIQAGRELVQGVNKMVNTFAGGADTPPKNPPLNEMLGKSGKGSQASNSGYVFFHSLARFMDYYIALKKTRNGRDVRLTWHMYKDKMYYDCLLRNFSFTKPPGTTEYQYRISLTSYMRREAPAGGATGGEMTFLQPEALATPPLLAKLVNGLKEVSAALDGMKGVLSGMKGDFNRMVLGPIKSVTAMMSSINGIAAEASTLGKQSTSEALKELKKTANSSVSRGQSPRETNQRTGQNALSNQASVANVTHTGEREEGIDIYTKDELIRFRNMTDLTQAIVEYFNTEDPKAKAAIKERIELLSQLVYGETATVNLDTTGQAEVSVQKTIEGADVQEVAALLAVATGLDAEVEEFESEEGTIAEEITVKATASAQNPEILEVQNTLNQASMHYNNIISMYDELFKTPTKTYADYYANYAVSEGIDFTNPTSQFMAPVDHGATMQSLALNYLGDADRWPEIAAINGLKEPYIDEVGFYKPLIASGSGNTVTVSDAENLNIGQVISLRSDVVLSEDVRAIEAIDIVDSTITILRLDGEPDLSKFTVADGAKLHTFLPSTLNSMKQVAIPSNEDVSIPRDTTYRMSPNASDQDQFAKIAKVDFLLNSMGDLVMGGSDVKLAYGMQNLTQALLLKLHTPLGSLVNDPAYGNPLTAGVNVADINTAQLVNYLDQMIGKDPRFGGVLTAKVLIQGPVGRITLAVNVKGTDYYMPVAAEGIL